MLIRFENLTIRNATTDDAEQLASWWNDRKIMAHAGFPNGTGETAEEIVSNLERNAEDSGQLLILERDEVPIGEMDYHKVGEGVAEIGIKICDFSLHDKGLGKIFLSMLIDFLFTKLQYKKIILDTNLKNQRAQHVYEQLGFRKVQVRENAWKNQLGELQSSVDYELFPGDFINYAKK